MALDDTNAPEPAPTKTLPRRRILHAGDIRRLVVFAVVLLVIVPACAWLAGGFRGWQDAGWQLGFDPSAFASAAPATRFHTVAILTLVATGWGMLALPKGDRRHKALGWIWVIGMGVMGLSSLAVPHGDSWVAAYVGGGSALVLLAYGVFAVKRRKLRNHGRTMAMLMIALVLMTLLSLLPGRLMHAVFFGGRGL
jgi:uncharacterized membrane protein